MNMYSQWVAVMLGLALVPLSSNAQSSIMSTQDSTTSSTSSATITNSGSGTIYSTVSPSPAVVPLAIGAANNFSDPAPAPAEPISDLDTPRKGFDDPRDPWDGRYSNDNPRNYDDGEDQRAAHAAARQVFINRNSPSGTVGPRNYTSGGVTYGPVRRR